MSLFDRLLEKFRDKDFQKKEPEVQENLPQETKPEVSPSDLFFDAIESMATQVKESFQPSSYTRYNADLSTITLQEFPTAEVTESTYHKIEELKSIVRTIEDKTTAPGEIKLLKSYKINYALELNNPQLEAVTTLNGPILVIAGAGSGKTRVIVHRVAFMLENGIFPQDILLLTFTRKAASEMIGRVQELLKDNSVQKIFGGTFHAFSNYVLRRYANLLNIPSNFTIIDSEDSADTIDLIKSELKLIGKEKAFPKKNRIQEIISSARNRNLTIRDVIENEFTGLIDFIPQLEMISQGYGRYKKICNLFDYDDLMDVLRDALRDHPVFRKKLQDEYRYIMVDEYQDTNVVQKEIVELIAEANRNVLVVGDDAQSIYSFRGANYENILRFPQKYPDCKVIKIEENYRSNQKILDFTNEIIRNALLGYKKQLYSKILRDSLPFVRKFYDQQSEAEFIVTKILEYREKGIALNQIAILVRAFWHARYIEIELTRRGIPYVAVGGLAFNERKHVKDIISYLRLLQNTYDAVAWHRILKYLPGVGLVTARKIIEKINSEKGLNVESFEKSKFAEGMKALINMLTEAGDPKKGVSHKMEIIKKYYAPILIATEQDSQIRLLDIDVLIDLAVRYESLEKFLTDFALDPHQRNSAINRLR